MANSYRSWEERRDIIRSIVAESNPPSLESFQLTPNEEVFFRARSARAIETLAGQTAEFKSYYALPIEKPFWYVIGLSSMIVAGAITFAIYLYLTSKDATAAYPLFAACATLAVAAIGWAVAGWITHRNTIRQNTNNLLFARFSHATFGEAMHRFHAEFQQDPSILVTQDRIKELRATGNEDDLKTAAAVNYLLNYFEFIASGVLRGDLDAEIVRDNIRGFIVYYYDKCEPALRYANRQNPKAYQNLIKLRTHYRQP